VTCHVKDFISCILTKSPWIPKATCSKKKKQSKQASRYKKTTTLDEVPERAIPQRKEEKGNGNEGHRRETD
jgi:hypothetical protein